MQAIHAEHETQDSLLQSRKAALDSIVSDITLLRQLGQENLDESSRAPTPHPEGDAVGAADTENANKTSGLANASVNDSNELGANTIERGIDSGKIAEDSLKSSSKASSPSPQLNPTAKPFRPQTQDSALRAALRNASGLNATLSMESRDATPLGGFNADTEDDIEMGEVEEVKVKSKKMKEDREEGEASDEGSVVSDMLEES